MFFNVVLPLVLLLLVIAIVAEVNINDEKSLSARIINWFVESVMKI